MMLAIDFLVLVLLLPMDKKLNFKVQLSIKSFIRKVVKQSI